MFAEVPRNQSERGKSAVARETNRPYARPTQRADPWQPALDDLPGAADGAAGPPVSPRLGAQMPSPRYTIRLPQALADQVQARVEAGTPFAVLMRDALSAYLADTPPTGAPTGEGSADTLHRLQEQLSALVQRVAALEQVPTGRRQERTPLADRAPTGAPTASAPPAFDPTRHRLGRLCPRGHDWQGTGQSLRANNKAGYCLACNAEDARKRRAAHRQPG